MTNMLSVFDLTKAKDDSGKVIDIDPDAFIDGIIMQVQDFLILPHPLTSVSISTPEPFACSITPRSAQAESLISGA